MKPDFLSRMVAGEAKLGLAITINAPEVAEIAAQAGMDWLWLDMEHGSLDVVDVQRACMAAPGSVCLARVPVNDEAWIKRVLDTGVDGLIIPQVNTAELARRAVDWTMYPPQGRRSVGAGRAHAYGASFETYIQAANRDLLLFIQIEHIDAVNNLDAILDVKGISGVIIGPYDLSASMGLTGQVSAPSVREAIERIRLTCDARNVAVGIFAADEAAARSRLAQGFRMVAAGTDVMFLSAGMGGLVLSLRG